MYIKESRISYTIYNSRTAGPILMILNFLYLSPSQIIAELLDKYRKNSSKKNYRNLIIVLTLLQYIFSTNNCHDPKNLIFSNKAIIKLGSVNTVVNKTNQLKRMYSC